MDNVVDVGEFSALAIPRLQWNFLDFGRVDAAIDQTGAARNEAVANYQQTVLLALQDAERALARFGQQRVALAASMLSVVRTFGTTRGVGLRSAGLVLV